MIIRKCKIDDIREVAKVSSSSFIWNVDWDELKELDGDMIIGSFMDDDKTMTAQIECLDFKNYINGKEVGCVGVGGVASKPEFRNQGAVRKIFKHLFEIAPENDWIISILYPFSVDYYRKFGYEPVGRYVKYELPFSNLKAIERSCNVMLYQGKNLEEISDVYNSISIKNDLAFKRCDNKYWNDKPYETCHYTYIGKNKNGESDAIINFIPNRQTSTIEVTELHFKNKDALLNILGFMRSYEGNYSTLIINKLPLNSPVYDLIGEKNQIKRTLCSNGAVRILDVEKLLGVIKYPNEHGHFSFKLSDEIEINNGIFDVEFENENAKVSRRKSGEYDIELNACSASRLFLGGEGFDFERMRYLSDVTVINENEDFIKAFLAKDIVYYNGF